LSQLPNNIWKYNGAVFGYARRLRFGESYAECKFTDSKLGTVVTFFPAKEETCINPSDPSNIAGRASRSASPPRYAAENEQLSQDIADRTELEAAKPPSRAVFSPADLRAEIYDDMNGGNVASDLHSYYT